MHLSWLGTTAMRLQVKPFDEDITIIIDPYKPTAGNFPRSFTPHIAILSRGEKDSVALSGEPFVFQTPGECEIKGVLMSAIQGADMDHMLVRVDAEGLSLAHLGLMNTIPTDAQLEVVGDVDILCIPVGGKGGYDAETAAKVVAAIEPRIVIPMAYQSENDPAALPLGQFLKEMGTTEGNPEKKIIIKKKDLPQDETKVIVLAKE